jgi:arginine decarboxylase
MASPNTEREAMDLVDFFSAAEARLDRWRRLLRIARSLAEASDAQRERLRGDAEHRLAEIAPLEAFWAYPGPRLLGALRERLAAGDGTGAARLVQRISSALLSGNYRRESDAWELSDNGETMVSDRLPPALDQAGAHRPYFEVLIVSPARRRPGTISPSSCGACDEPRIGSSTSRCSSAASRTPCSA